MNGADLEQFELCDVLRPAGERIPISVVTSKTTPASTLAASGKHGWCAKEILDLCEGDGRGINGLIVLIGHEPRRNPATDESANEAAGPWSAQSTLGLAPRRWTIRSRTKDSEIVGMALPSDASIAEIAAARRMLLELFGMVSIEMSLRVS